MNHNISHTLFLTNGVIIITFVKQYSTFLKSMVGNPSLAPVCNVHITAVINVETVRLFREYGSMLLALSFLHNTYYLHKYLNTRVLTLPCRSTFFLVVGSCLHYREEALCKLPCFNFRRQMS